MSPVETIEVNDEGEDLQLMPAAFADHTETVRALLRRGAILMREMMRGGGTDVCCHKHARSHCANTVGVRSGCECSSG